MIRRGLALRALLAIMSLLWVAMLGAERFGVTVPAWRYVRTPLAVSTAIFGVNALVLLLDAIAVRRHRRRVERERAEFLRASAEGFLNGRGVVTRCRR